MRNRSTNDAKLKLEKVMPTRCQHDQTLIQNRIAKWNQKVEHLFKTTEKVSKKAAMVGPMAPKGVKMESKSSVTGGQKVTCSGKVAESWPLREH